MSTPLTRKQALYLLEQATSAVAGIDEQVNAEAVSLVDKLAQEGRKQAQQNRALLLALVSDELIPIKFFKDFASYPRFRDWRDSGLLKCDMRNGKVCVKPSDFFSLWRRLDPKNPLQVVAGK